MLTLPVPLTLRAVGAHDQAFLAALYASTRDDLGSMAAEPAFIAQLIALQQQMQAQGLRGRFPEAAYFIVERNGAAIGRVVIDAGAAQLHLVDLALSAEARGQGAGTSVLKALQAWAGGRGVPLTLSVSHANPAAARLYARLGFTTVDADAMQQRMQWRDAPS